MTGVRAHLFVLCLVALLQSCAAPPLAPVVERETLSLKAEMDSVGGTLIRIVQPGDTLYSITFELALDVNKVAAWNGLSDTAKLQVGQRIRLTPPLNFKPPVLRNKLDTVAKVKKTPVVSSAQVKGGVKKTPPAPIKKPALNVSQWQWPTEGKVVGYFSPETGKQGIDIQGRRGQNVVAASAGEVVYVGNALKGYGNLVIIKHSQQFLTAYAFNEEIFVKESQIVEKNRLIAKMGMDKLSRSVLHFQLRGYGKALNPMKFLPKKM